MENSWALLTIDSFHVSCSSTWLTSLPHSSAHSRSVFLTSSSSWPFSSSLTLPLPAIYLYGQASAYLCKPLSNTHPTINVKTHPRAPNLTAECVILAAALQKHTILQWHLMIDRLRWLRKTHFGDSHQSNERNSGNINWIAYSCSNSSFGKKKKKRLLWTGLWFWTLCSE